MTRAHPKSKPIPRRFGTAKTIFFSLIPAFALVVCAEIGLRLTGAADRCPSYKNSILWECDPLLHFRMNKYLVIDGKPLNSKGFRTREFTPKKPGIFRILTLGDSCTIGFMTPVGSNSPFVKAPYPQRLEQLVVERIGPGRVEVLNVGTCGYNSYQGIMLLRTKLRRLSPDLVTVRYGWNDLLTSAERNIEGAFREPETALARGFQDLLLETALYPFARRLGMALRTAHTPTSAPLSSTWTPNVPVEEYERNLRRIAELTRAQGAEVWFLTSPDAFMTKEYHGRYDEFTQSAQKQLDLIKLGGIPSFEQIAVIHSAYNFATRRVGRDLGVPVVDMAAAYMANAGRHLFEPADVLHPNQRGHVLEAEVLYRRLEDTRVIPAADVPSAPSRSQHLRF